MDKKGKTSKMTYPLIYFTVDNFEEVSLWKLVMLILSLWCLKEFCILCLENGLNKFFFLSHDVCSQVFSDVAVLDNQKVVVQLTAFRPVSAM